MTYWASGKNFQWEVWVVINNLISSMFYSGLWFTPMSAGNHSEFWSDIWLLYAVSQEKQMLLLIQIHLIVDYRKKISLGLVVNTLKHNEMLKVIGEPLLRQQFTGEKMNNNNYKQYKCVWEIQCDRQRPITIKTIHPLSILNGNLAKYHLLILTSFTFNKSFEIWHRAQQ